MPEVALHLVNEAKKATAQKGGDAARAAAANRLDLTRAKQKRVHTEEDVVQAAGGNLQAQQAVRDKLCIEARTIIDLEAEDQVDKKVNPSVKEEQNSFASLEGQRVSLVAKRARLMDERHRIEGELARVEQEEVELGIILQVKALYDSGVPPSRVTKALEDAKSLRSPRL